MKKRMCTCCKQEKAETLEFFGKAYGRWQSACKTCKNANARRYSKKKRKVDCPCVICGGDRGTNHARCDLCVSQGRPLPGTLIRWSGLLE